VLVSPGPNAVVEEDFVSLTISSMIMRLGEDKGAVPMAQLPLEPPGSDSLIDDTSTHPQLAGHRGVRAPNANSDLT
jgi:hypothetical protein